MENKKPRNPRLTAKDRALIKGALRKAFARSDLHRQVLEAGRIEHSSEKNPRCLKWNWCEACGVVLPQWRVVLDHVQPVIPLDQTFEEMSLDDVVDRMWCVPENLQRLCDTCHDAKTAAERVLRPKRPRKKKSDAKA